MPPQGSQGVVLLSPKVWNGHHGGEDLEIGIACFTTPPPLTGDQTHTHTPVLAQSVDYVRPSNLGILDVLISFPSLHLPSMLSSISSTGCHILYCLAPSSYMQVLLSDPMEGGST
jgi:hypothetical protein